MYKIIIQRLKEYKDVEIPDVSKSRTPDVTIGQLTVFDEQNKELYKCYTLERIGPSTDKSGLKRRIVARDYKLEWKYTSVTLPKQYRGRGLLLTCDDVLPKFRNRAILIHIGNYGGDSLGCILLGKTHPDVGAIYNSTEAVKEFYDLISRIRAENFILTIREIGE